MAKKKITKKPTEKKKPRLCNLTKRGGILFLYVKKAGTYAVPWHFVKRMDQKRNAFQYAGTKEENDKQIELWKKKNNKRT